MARSLAARHSTLYHVAEEDALPGIQRHGLLSTSSLLALFEVQEPRRTTLQSTWRSGPECIAHPLHGTAVLRDQQPMRPEWLRKCLLGGLTPSDWYRVLNSKVFLWPSERSVAVLLSAGPYRDRAHLVIGIDTASLLADGRHRVAVSRINSGNARRRPAPRDLSLFIPADAADLPSRIAEVVVEDAIPDVMSHVRSVEIRHEATVLRRISPPTPVATLGAFAGEGAG